MALTCVLPQGMVCGNGRNKGVVDMIDLTKKEYVVVQLSSCIAKDNFHAPPCPHLDYLKSLLARIGLDVCEDTVISETSQRRRAGGPRAHE